MFGAKAFALSARKKQHLHKNPGRCPGLLAAAPLGRRWVLVIVRADTGVCPYGWMSTTLSRKPFERAAGALNFERAERIELRAPRGYP